MTKKADDEAPTVLQVNGHEVRITHPSKVYFPARSELRTKLDLVRYYLAVDERIMRTTRNRPVMLQRFPGGASGPSFYQKRVPDSAPDWITQCLVYTPNGTESNALVAADVAHLLWAVNMGCLGFHVWPSHANDIEHPDELRIDLDPGKGVTFEQVREAAHEVKRFFDELGITSYAKTSGSRGLHIYVHIAPTHDATTVRAAAVAFARAMERRRPDLVTASWWKEERGTRVFIDFNQNCPHKTVFGAWCVRAVPSAQVSTPFAWDELPTVSNEAFTIATVPARGDPWERMYEAPQSLEPLLALAAADKANGLMDAPWPPVYPKQPGEPPRVQPSRAKKLKPIA
jgi:DNA ligase D